MRDKGSRKPTEQDPPPRVDIPEMYKPYTVVRGDTTGKQRTYKVCRRVTTTGYDYFIKVQYLERVRRFPWLRTKLVPTSYPLCNRGIPYSPHALFSTMALFDTEHAAIAFLHRVLESIIDVE